MTPMMFLVAYLLCYVNAVLPQAQGDDDWSTTCALALNSSNDSYSYSQLNRCRSKCHNCFLSMCNKESLSYCFDVMGTLTESLCCKVCSYLG